MTTKTKTKPADNGNITTAEARELLQAEQAERIAACRQELEVLLDKHGCRLVLLEARYSRESRTFQGLYRKDDIFYRIDDYQVRIGGSLIERDRKNIFVVPERGTGVLHPVKIYPVHKVRAIVSNWKTSAGRNVVRNPLKASDMSV